MIKVICDTKEGTMETHVYGDVWRVDAEEGMVYIYRKGGKHIKKVFMAFNLAFVVSIETIEGEEDDATETD